MASKGIEKLLADAERAGCSVNRKDERFEISRVGQKAVSLVILPDGTAYRGDVDLTVTLAIRTQKEMRKVVNIPLSAEKTVALKKFTVIINGSGGYSSHKVKATNWKEARNTVEILYKLDNPDEPPHEVGVAATISGWHDVWC